MNVELTTLTMKDMDRAVDVLARAFHDDPVMNWMCDRPAFLELMFELTLPVFIPHGLTCMAEGDRGAISWLGPEVKLAWPFSPSNILRVLRVGGLGSLYRFLSSGVKIERYHPEAPHYYLFAIGTPPEFKRQGVGTALIKPVLQRCDDEGVPAYLENSKEENLRFYRGHGFEVQQEISLGRDAPPVWLMWREPREQTDSG